MGRALKLAKTELNVQMSQKWLTQFMSSSAWPLHPFMVTAVSSNNHMELTDGFSLHHHLILHHQLNAII